MYIKLRSWGGSKAKGNKRNNRDKTGKWWRTEIESRGDQ